ncbi:MAG: Gfo/Idh/MocA family protein [Gemmobacter sp.]
MRVPLPLCVIGGGQIGLRHAQVAVASERILLTAVVEPRAARRAELAALGLPAVPTLGDVPAGTRAAVVATPTQDHAAAGLAALAEGWGLIVEKPLAATLAEARALCAAAARAGLALVTGHHRRCHPFVQAARAQLPALGDPVGVQALWSLRKHEGYFDEGWRRRPGAGVMMTNLSHEIDLMQMLLGPIEEVSALLSRARRELAVEDTAALSLRFANGALGSVLISDAGASPWGFEAATGENPMLAASGQDYLRVIGTAGALELPSLRRWRGDDWRLAMHPQDGPRFAAVDPLAVQLERFADLMDGAPDDVLCTGPQGRSAAAATLACALSATEARPVRPESVPDDYRGFDAEAPA